VWQPDPPLALVQAELLEAGLHARGEGGRGPGRVVEDEHSDRPGLAVADHLEHEGLGRGGFAPEDVDDRCEECAGLRSEEGDGDVMGLGPPSSVNMAFGPRSELIGHIAGKLERDEEPERVIDHDATGRAHARV
jgi:hypothetical protein